MPTPTLAPRRSSPRPPREAVGPACAVLDHATDARLLARRAGDAAALEALLRRHWAPLLASMTPSSPVTLRTARASDGPPAAIRSPHPPCARSS